MINTEGKQFETSRDRLQQAILWQKKALAGDPTNPQYRKHLNKHLVALINVAQRLGDSKCAAATELELTNLRASDPATVDLDERLAAIIKGDKQPKDNAERLALAQRAYDKGLYASAARLWSEALEADPKLGDNRQTQHRYKAASSAALAGCGKGKDDPPPDDVGKAKLRKQALSWLKAELAVWSKIVETGPTEAKTFLTQTLNQWKKDTDLASVRDEKELAALLQAERNEWQDLWAEVDAVLMRVQSSMR